MQVGRDQKTHSGQACLVTVPSALLIEGHVPSAYKALKTAEAVDKLAKDVPTTVMSPVPMKYLVLGILIRDI